MRETEGPEAERVAEPPPRRWIRTAAYLFRTFALAFLAVVAWHLHDALTAPEPRMLWLFSGLLFLPVSWIVLSFGWTAREERTRRRLAFLAILPLVAGVVLLALQLTELLD